jgi:hypothetical protein
MKTLNEVMIAENKRRAECEMAPIINVFLCEKEGRIYGELELRNPIVIGFHKNGEYRLTDI